MSTVGDYLEERRQRQAEIKVISSWCALKEIFAFYDPWWLLMVWHFKGRAGDQADDALLGGGRKAEAGPETQGAGHRATSSAAAAPATAAATKIERTIWYISYIICTNFDSENANGVLKWHFLAIVVAIVVIPSLYNCMFNALSKHEIRIYFKVTKPFRRVYRRL